MSLSFFENSAFGQDTSAAKDSISKSITPINSSDSLIAKDTIAVKDSLSADTSDIETTIHYSAEDSIVMDVNKKMVYLYGKAKINYGEMSLEAEYVQINWETNVMTAYPGTDSTGKTFGKPIFKDGQDMYVVDTIRYNAKTKKGIIKGIVTKQGEGYVTGEKVKRIDENLFINNAHYTTCDLSHPHFYINANKLKVIPNDKVVSGPFNMVIADVPTPLGFILGYFPMPKKRKSGLIFPTIGTNASRGFSLRQGGYYWAVNDYLGLQFIGDAYANGSYRTSLSGRYIKRYVFQGNFAFNFSQIKQSFEPNEIPVQDINFQWSHNTLRKRNSNFQANVNAGSNSFFKRNSYNPTTFQQGSFSSAVTYYKAFGNTPFNINATLRQDQDIRSGVMNFTLPEVTANMNRINPFKNLRSEKNGAAASFVRNLNFQYTGNAKFFVTNDSTKTDTTTLPFNGKNLEFLLSKAQFGAKHTVPLNTTIKFKKTFLKNFNFSPGILFEDWMYQDVTYKYDSINKRVIRENGTKLQNAYAVSGSIQVNTNIYGMYKFKGKLMGLRHTINPSLGFTYKPKNNQGLFPLDTNGVRIENLQRFANSPYGGPSQALANLLTFNVNNILEAKTRGKGDSIAPKKFKVLDQLSLSTSYDFAREEFNLSNIVLTGRSRIANRVDIYGSATFDPYDYDSVIVNGISTFQRVDRIKLLKSKLISYNLSVGTSFNPEAKNKKYESKKGSQQELAQINANPLDYIDFSIPWNLTVNYNLNYSRNFTSNSNSSITQALSFVGEVALTEKWKITFNTGYDLEANAITTTRIDIFRDLHCWQMSLNIVPFGAIQSYGFTINAKSSILQDLKLSKRNSNYFGSYY